MFVDKTDKEVAEMAKIDKKAEKQEFRKKKIHTEVAWKDICAEYQNTRDLSQQDGDKSKEGDILRRYPPKHQMNKDIFSRSGVDFRTKRHGREDEDSSTPGE